jgi:putative two-component system response regulator
MFHHEKLNGSGYPNKISGGKIPGFVRIVTVADIYDAITMKRPYHEPSSHEYGVDFLLHERDAGNLDKDVIEAFQIRENEILDIKHTFKDNISTNTQKNQLWIPDIDEHLLP